MRSIAVFLAAVLLSTIPVRAEEKCVPQIPRDLRLICHQGNWAVISDSAREGAIYDAPCGNGLA